MWRNSKELFALTSNSNHAYSVFVVGEDVYTAGDESNGTKTVAKVWKNKKEIFKTDGSKHAAALSVYVVGDDVYVAGDEGDVAKVWKNKEELYELANNGSARSIVVYNGDVYVAGFEKDGSSNVARCGKTAKSSTRLPTKALPTPYS